MKPSRERREATVGGKSEETEKGKNKKRVGHGWSRTGERAESGTLGLELMELPFLQQYRCMLCFPEHVLPPPPQGHRAFGSSSSLTLARFVMLCLSPTIK